MTTVQDLAETIHAAYQDAEPPERWQAAALAVIAKLNELPVAADIRVTTDGMICIERAPGPSADGPV